MYKLQHVKRNVFVKKIYKSRHAHEIRVHINARICGKKRIRQMKCADKSKETYFKRDLHTRWIDGKETCTHCNTLQHTATHWNTLQHSATLCNTLQHNAKRDLHTRRIEGKETCNTLQHTATHCNTLQHTATHCNNTLQHTATAERHLQHKLSYAFS